MFDDIFRKANEYLDVGEDLVLVEIVESSATGTPRKEGAIMFVTANTESFGTIGGGNVEYQATQYACDLLKKKTGGEKIYNLSQNGTDNIGMVCGGESHLRFTYLTNDARSREVLEALKEKYKNKHTVYIFGAGHVSMELSKILKYIDFDVVVWDDRDSFVNAKRFPNVNKLVCKSYDNVLDEIDITDNDFIVVMTRGHAYDYLVEKQVLKSKAAYIGVIGSSSKNKVLRDKLIIDGFTETRVRNVCAPIGVSVAAETPEEIAISIACELILFRSRLEKRRKVMEDNRLVDIYKERGINL